jgi:hypothetical protein
MVAIVLVGAGGASDFAYTSVKSQADQLQNKLTADLRAGQTELEIGRASLTLANTKHDPNFAAEANTHFVGAKDRFVAAGDLADGSQLLHWLEQLPAVGEGARSRHTAVSGISVMGAAISDAGQQLASLDEQLLKPPAAGSAGRTLLTALGQSHTGLATVRTDFERAQKAAAQVDVRVLPAGQQGTFLKARDTIGVALAGLDEFDRLVPILTDVLGGNGPRTYLVEQANPAELRAGGGFIGTYSLVRADQGKLTVIRSGSAADLAEPRPQRGQAGWVPEPGPLREVIPNESWSFLDSNLYPDFASNARAAERWVQPRLAMKIDGVVSMDYYTVASILRLTGPLVVPGYRITLDASNFVSVVFQYDIARSAIHKAILSAVAGPLMQRISTLTPDRWPALLATLNGLVGQRHFATFFNNANVEQEIDRVGWSGTVNPGSSPDYLMEVESNYTGNKVNYFITRHYTVELTRNGGTLHHKVTIDLVNRTPYGVEERTYYHVNIRLYVGTQVTRASSNLTPVKYANPAPPAGTNLLDGWLPAVNCCGGRGSAVFQYETPWPIHDRGLDSIYWQKQPGTNADGVDVIWNDGNGHSYKVSGNLGQDRVIMLTPSGVVLVAGEAAQARLPSLSLG